MSYTYPIYRANDTNLRRQIMDALQDIDQRIVVFSHFPAVKNQIDEGEAFIIQTAHQLLVWEYFMVNGGDIVIEGDLVIL